MSRDVAREFVDSVMAPSQGEPTKNSDSLPTDNIFTVLEVPAVQDSRKRRYSEGDHEIATPTPK